MTKNELKKLLELSNETQIILHADVNLRIDGDWYERLSTVTDVETFKNVYDKMLNENATMPLYIFNYGHEVDIDEFIKNASYQQITKAEADVLNKYNAFNTLRLDEFFEFCSE